jgi:hypothetical protein
VTIVRDLAQQIDWLAPFLNAKARESGDVAGMQMNAREAARMVRATIHFFEAQDETRAKDLAKQLSDTHQPETK